jgi:flagellar assembly protein FliH
MSTVIKAHHRSRASGAIAFNLDDVSRQAQEYLDTVQSQAEAIIAEARAKADAIVKAAEEQGREAALRSARELVEQRLAEQLETLLPALRQAVTEVGHARQTCLGHWERQGLHVAAAIAGRIVRRELSRQPEITLDLIREALELSAGSPQVRVLLNPADHAALADQARRLAAEFAPLGPAEVVADPAVSAGGCRVETRFGVIDQGIESQLRRIEEELA